MMSHMIFTPLPCRKLLHFLRPLHLEHDVLYGRPHIHVFLSMQLFRLRIVSIHLCSASRSAHQSEALQITRLGGADAVV